MKHVKQKCIRHRLENPSVADIGIDKSQSKYTTYQVRPEAWEQQIDPTVPTPSASVRGQERMMHPVFIPYMGSPRAPWSGVPYSFIVSCRRCVRVGVGTCREVREDIGGVERWCVDGGVSRGVRVGFCRRCCGTTCPNGQESGETKRSAGRGVDAECLEAVEDTRRCSYPHA